MPNISIINALNKLARVNKKYTDGLVLDNISRESLPSVFFTSSDMLELDTKADGTRNTEVEMRIGNKTIICYATVKVQGTSSQAYDKKNYTVVLYDDSGYTTKKKIDVGWGEQSKYCFKANYTDSTHTRNLSGARIGYDMVSTRPNSDFKTNLSLAPRNGLVDGFPIKVYINGEFHGIYTWNIPKDTWTFNMDESNPNHMVLCAEKNGMEHGQTSCQFRQTWDGNDGNNGTGGDWSVEVGTLTESMLTSFNNAISFVINSTDEEFKANISNHFDLDSLIDYFCFCHLCCHLDGMGKNLLMMTYDGVHWGASLYDMDALYGAFPQGNFTSTDAWLTTSGWREPNSLLWERLADVFAVELKTRYFELRKGALSLGNIVTHVEEIYNKIPDRVFNDEHEKWTEIPYINQNTMTRFRNYMRDRATFSDNYFNSLQSLIACTGITLNNTSLSFTNNETQTLVATVTPSNTTQPIRWSVDNSSIVSVNNGVITPLTNGSCTVTASCGSYSATCSITVNIELTISSEFAQALHDATIWQVFGDSISTTYNISENQIWHNLITADSTYSGITKYNNSLTGSEISDGGRDIDSFVERYTSLNASADLVTIFGGVNDWAHNNIPLGNYDDVTTNQSFYGALNTLLPGIEAQCPNARIIWLSPLKTKSNQAVEQTNADGTNTLGLYLTDYIQAIKYKCHQYNIEFVDLYGVTGLDPDVNTGNFQTDGLHLNASGHIALRDYLLNTATPAVPEDIYAPSTVSNTVTVNGLHDNNHFNLFYAIDASNLNSGDTVVVSWAYSNASTTPTNFNDSASFYSNSYENAIRTSINDGCAGGYDISQGGNFTSGTSTMTVGNNDNNYPYFLAMTSFGALSTGSLPITWTINSLSVTVNGAEVPILGAGGFFTDESIIVDYNFAGDNNNIISELGYVSNNAIFVIDGIQNNKTGHNSSSTVWEDLSYNENNIDFSSINTSYYTINNNSLEVASSNGLNLVSSKNVQNVTTNFTIEVAAFLPSDLSTQSWLMSTRPLATNYDDEIVDNGGPYTQLLYTSDSGYANDMLFVLDNGSENKIGNSGVSVLGEFHTYQYVYDGSTLSQYVDGVYINNVSTTTTDTGFLGGRLRLFSWDGSYGCAIGTKIHAVRIYDTNLAATQLLANANNDKQRFTSNSDSSDSELLLQLLAENANFETGVWTDTSGNDKNATLYNFTNDGTTNGLINGKMVFTTGNNYASIPTFFSGLTPVNQITVTIKDYKTTASGSWGEIVSMSSNINNASNAFMIADRDEGLRTFVAHGSTDQIWLRSGAPYDTSYDLTVIFQMGESPTTMDVYANTTLLDYTLLDDIYNNTDAIETFNDTDTLYIGTRGGTTGFLNFECSAIEIRKGVHIPQS